MDTVIQKSVSINIIGKKPRQNTLDNVIRKSVGKSNRVIGKEPKQN
jgi:hypothetical protein